MSVRMTRRCTWKPVRHTCGHFEARYMRFDVDPDLGYTRAGNACSQCASDRPAQPNYPDLASVQAHCDTQNTGLHSTI